MEPISQDRLNFNLRVAIMAIVEERMAGSREAAPHTHIECFCDGHIHRKPNYDQGCFCPDCAADAAETLGYPRSDIEVEAPDGNDDGPKWCETCGRLISAMISPACAEEELAEWESRCRRQRRHKRTQSPEEWRAFMLCARHIEDKHLPRVALLLERTQPVSYSFGDLVRLAETSGAGRATVERAVEVLKTRAS